MIGFLSRSDENEIKIIETSRFSLIDFNSFFPVPCRFFYWVEDRKQDNIHYPLDDIKAKAQYHRIITFFSINVFVYIIIFVYA